MNIAISMFGAKDSTSINTAYLEYMSAAGLNPIIVTKYNNFDEIVNMCDGLLLPGGVDLEPTFYDEDNIASSGCSPEKDNFERTLMGLFIGQHKKIFGICRGFQLIVREFLRIFEKHSLHHSFYQHVNDHNLVNSRGVARNVPTHSVKANVKLLYGVNADNQAIYVNSIHHQALVCLDAQHININVDADNKLRALAITNFSTPKIGIKESIIIEAVDVLLGGVELRGVQWHPEELMDVALLQTFFLDKKVAVGNANGAGN